MEPDRLPPPKNGTPIRNYSFEFGKQYLSDEPWLPVSPGMHLEFGGGYRAKPTPAPRWRRRGPGRWLWRAWAWARYPRPFGIIRKWPVPRWRRRGPGLVLWRAWAWARYRSPEIPGH